MGQHSRTSRRSTVRPVLSSKAKSWLAEGSLALLSVSGIVTLIMHW